MRWARASALLLIVIGSAPPLPARSVDAGSDELRLTEQAVVRNDELVPDYVGWIALAGLAAVSVLSLFSIGERTPGDESAIERVIGASHTDDLYLPARIVRSAPGHKGEALSLRLRGIGFGRATLLSTVALVTGENLTLTVTPNAVGSATFHGRVLHCKAAGNGSGWFVVRVKALSEKLDAAGMTAVQDAVASAPS